MARSEPASRWDLGLDHPLVRARDYASLWVFRFKAAKSILSILFFGGLFINTLPATLDHFGLLHLYPITIVITVLSVVFIAGMLDWTRTYNSIDRQKTRRQANFVHPQRAIDLLIQARQFDQAFGLDGAIEAETRGLIAHHSRGIDMEQFDRMGEGNAP